MKRLLFIVFLVLLLPRLAFAKEPQEYYREERYKKLFWELQDKGFTIYKIGKVFYDPRVKFYKFLVKPRKRSKQDKDYNPYFDPQKKWISTHAILRGKRFLIESKNPLDQTEKRFGVDRGVSSAIGWIESRFGSNTGQYRVFNVYNTQFAWKNSKRAKAELVDLFLLAKKLDLDPLSIKGSYGGAIAWPQFVPSSYLRIAIDGDGDGKINLWEKTDALFSIAYYLKLSGYVFGEPECKKSRKAIWWYNHSWNYVDAVIYLSRQMSTEFTPELKESMVEFDTVRVKEYAKKNYSRDDLRMWSRVVIVHLDETQGDSLTHYYIARDGNVYQAIPDSIMTPHCLGLDWISVGIGADADSLGLNGKQCDALIWSVEKLLEENPSIKYMLDISEAQALEGHFLFRGEKRETEFEESRSAGELRRIIKIDGYKIKDISTIRQEKENIWRYFFFQKR